MSTEHVTIDWLRTEYDYSSAKFGEHQVDTLTQLALSNNASFGGQAAMYWSRMRAFDQGDAVAQRAQAAAKMANTTRSLWSAIRSFDRSSERHAAQDALWVIKNHLEVEGFRAAKTIEHKEDFWETPIGLGLTYLELHIKRHGFAQKFRLGQLMRAEQIMLDAADVAALQFEHCLDVHGAVPRPGLSSGNIELWVPSQNT